MKNIFKFIFASVLVLGLASCEEKMNMDLDIPGDVTLTDVQYSSCAQQGNVTLFTVSLTGEAGKAAIVFAAEGWQLPAGTYTPSADAVAAGNYVVGRTSVNGFLVESGNIVVTEGGIEGNVVCEGANVHFKYSGALPTFEQPVAPVALKTVLSAQSNVANGTKSVSFSFLQEGVSQTQVPNDPNNPYAGTTTVWNGEGNYLSLDVYSEDGLLYEGIYNANKEGGKLGKGEFGIGYDGILDMGFFQMQFENWGTCWWTVKDGKATAQKVLSGTLTVIQLDEKNFEITLEGVAGEGETATEVYAQFTGDLAKFAVSLEEEDDTPFDYGDYTPLTKLHSANPQADSNLLSLVVSTEGVTAVNDDGTAKTISGEGNALCIDIYAAGGNIAPGTYTACATGGTVGEGEFGIGWDPGDLWGIGMVFSNWGTVWVSANGCDKVVSGTITVEEDKGGKYILTIEAKTEGNKTIHAKYRGKVTK